MKQALQRIELDERCFHFVDGVKVYGPPPGLRGNVTGLRGDVTGLRGNVSDLQGSVTGLRGDVTGLRGDVTGLWGDVTECEITAEDRAAGVDVATIIAETAEEAAP